MIDKELLEALIRMIDDSSLDNLEIERGGTRIRLSKSPDSPAGAVHAAPMAAAPAPPPVAAAPPPAPATESGGASAPPASNLVDVTSPMVGTFYRAPAPDAQPYVNVGKQVETGDVLCIIEAMKLMNELECETPGSVAEVCVENGEPVEYGQVLFRIDPA
ncbi:MAG: acetyl-CoA carboxylase biotin carboxyl carrier protein [Gemmatimonadetes bacterium]|nr:acetyl-CoA carboxylase biotin carboxyl carrier protein [Gemmatimonadota bacterium]